MNPTGDCCHSNLASSAYGQVIVVGQPVGEQLEDGILSECIVIALIFVAGDDAKDATAGHLQKE